jgi:hypothetical protein
MDTSSDMENKTSEILIEPLNPSGFTKDEIKDLVEQLQSLDPNHDVKVAFRGVGGAGPEWVEMISLWIPWDSIAAGAAGAVVGKTVEWLLSRPTKKAEAQSQEQLSEEGLMPTVVLHVYGPNGEILQSVRKRPGTEPEYGYLEMADSYEADRPPVRED